MAAHKQGIQRFSSCWRSKLQNVQGRMWVGAKPPVGPASIKFPLNVYFFWKTFKIISFEKRDRKIRNYLPSISVIIFCILEGLNRAHLWGHCPFTALLEIDGCEFLVKFLVCINGAAQCQCTKLLSSCHGFESIISVADAMA
jgi:hypothetical protein